MNPNGSEFKEFFKTENVLSEETAKTCEGIMSIVECERALKMMESNKTPGTDVLTSEFYRYFWNTAGKFMAKCIYTLFDGLTYNTRGYFASCVVFFRAP